MSQGGDRPRIEKVMEKDLKNDSVKSGFRRDLYKINTNEGESSSHTSNIREYVENSVKERNPQIDLSGSQRNLDIRHLNIEKEEPRRGSEQWNEQQNRSIYQNRRYRSIYQKIYDRVVEQRCMGNRRWYEKWDRGIEASWKGSEQWDKEWDKGIEERKNAYKEQKRKNLEEEIKQAKEELDRLEGQQTYTSAIEQQKLDSATKPQTHASAIEQQKLGSSTGEVLWKGRKASTKLNEQRRSTRRSR